MAAGRASASLAGLHTHLAWRRRPRSNLEWPQAPNMFPGVQSAAGVQTVHSTTSANRASPAQAASYKTALREPKLRKSPEAVAAQLW